MPFTITVSEKYVPLVEAALETWLISMKKPNIWEVEPLTVKENFAACGVGLAIFSVVFMII